MNEFNLAKRTFSVRFLLEILGVEFSIDFT
jgi:hypothetical protein